MPVINKALDSVSPVVDNGVYPGGGLAGLAVPRSQHKEETLRFKEL